ncbi:hypothetical protein AgCh_018137 [Apium graveolens]
MQHAKAMCTPLAPHFKLSSKQCPTNEVEKKEMQRVPYSSAVGSLMYLKGKSDLKLTLGGTELTLRDAPFTRLKYAMTTTPVLTLPDYSIPFTVKTDAYDSGIEAVLMQQRRLPAFLSKTLSKRHQGMSTYEKEFLAVNLATQR